MRLLTEQTAPVRLLAMFVLLTGLPLAALGWLGWYMLDQERALENERRRERLENTANQLADRLAKVSDMPAASELPPGVVWLLFDAHGLIRRQGLALPYYPAVAPAPEAPAEMFASAEIVEVRQANPTKAAETYRALAGSPDRATRAAALVRLARALRQQGRTQEALAVYDDLADLGATPVAGAPAELVGRRQRAALLDNAGETAAAASERNALAAVLTDGRYALDPATFELYRKDLPALPLETERWNDGSEYRRGHGKEIHSYP